MTFLNLIKKQLEKIKFFLKSDKERFRNSEIIDVSYEINKISHELETIRREVVPTINQPRISSLNPEQLIKIREQAKLLNTGQLAINNEILKDLLAKIEILTTNKFLQQRSTFQIKAINDNILHEVKKTLHYHEYSNNKSIELNHKRQLQLEKRLSEIETLKSLKKDLMNFSLIEIQRLRNEEIRKIERIKKDRMLESKYMSHLDNAKLQLERLKFDLALEELDSAIKFKPERFTEIESLRENIISQKTQYERKKFEFNTLIKHADNESKRQEFKAAIRILENAKRLNFNDIYCDNKISATRNKIMQIKKLEEARKKLEQDELEQKSNYKDDASEIIGYLRENKILCFYHYTDSRNLNSIIQNNGLFSLNELIKRRITFIRGSETGEKPDYVRLSYTSSHPLLFVSIKNDRILNPKVLEINLIVATFRGTLFSNVNAARSSTPPTAIFGSDLLFLKNNVKFDIIKQDFFHLSPEKRPYYQAEVLVKEHLPLEHITNLTKQ